MTRGLTLAVDGSTYAGTVAVIRDDVVIASAQLQSSGTPGKAGRDEGFLPMVATALKQAGVKPSELDRVVCGAGPGSFTSLRVAASIAKGIAVGAGCPMFAASSLLLMAAGKKDGRYMATLPAMRGQVHTAVIEVINNRVSASGPDIIISENEIGDAAVRAGAQQISGIPEAKVFAMILDDVIESGPCDIDSWEPSYGRLAEAQVKWEAAHGRPLSAR
jgi:tRNA threonylcarbamoyladenosine biosynthesis protein TsaB